jgi:hypothetical protein
LSEPVDSELVELRRRTLDLYAAITLLMLLGIGILIAYAIRLGPLTSPGAEESFGLSVALMSIMGAVVFHVADRTYRVWPLGRRFRPSRPAMLTAQDWVRFLKVLVLVLAVAAVAYLVGGLLT